MRSVSRIVVCTLGVVGWTGLGVFLWHFMTPSHEQLLEKRAEETKKNPARMAELRSQNEMWLKVIKDAAETKVNVTNNPKWNSK